MQSLQDQFSSVQSQQIRMLELLSPLHPVLQSVPLHINLARNAILEKIPEGCPCTNDCHGGLTSATQPSCHTLSTQESAEPPLKVRKRTRTYLDGQNCGPHPPVNRYEDQAIAVEERQILHQPACKPGEIQTSSRPQRTGTHCGVRTPSGGINGIGGVIRNHIRNTGTVSRNAALASRPSTIPRGIALPSILVSPHSEHGLRIVRQRKNSKFFEGEFAFTISGYMTTSYYAGPCYGRPGEEIHLV